MLLLLAQTRLGLEAGQVARQARATVQSMALACKPGLVLAAQMGGPAGVEAAEVNNLTLQPGTGLFMCAQSRAALACA